MQIHDYQQAAVDDALAWLATARAGDKRLYASPTGTGKSYMELALQAAVSGAWIVTPRLEIIAGMLCKAGRGQPAGASEARVLAAAHEARITTPIRLRSSLLAGEASAPRLLIFDEAHHDLAESYQDIHLLCGFAPAIGFTATPYRGTPKGTAAFREQWGDPIWVVTMGEAVERGVLAFPHCETVPLVDDDLIEVANGELIAKQVNSAVGGRINAVAELARKYTTERTGVDGSGMERIGFDRPTMFSLPSRELCYSLHTALQGAGIQSAVVTGETPYGERQTAFRACCECKAALIQVAVVSEGVDLPIRRLIDLSPTLSPVKWLQQFGRITRPSSEAPHYVCTNRNLLRHGYLLDGCLPATAMSHAQAAFPTPSKRTGLRAVGMEALGRLKPVELSLTHDGLKALCYNLSSLVGHIRTDYFVFVHPCREEVIWTKRESVRTAAQEYAWGRWHRCQAPSDITGFASATPSPLSEKQAAWWAKDAKRVGLNPEAKITRKEFAALPVLLETRVRL